MDSDDELFTTCDESISKEETSDLSLENKINDLLCKHDGSSFSTLAFITISLGISSTAFYA